MELKVDEVLTVLNAFPPDVVNAALAARGQARRGDRERLEAVTWKEWTGEGLPGKPYEWKEVNGVLYYRNPPPPGAQEVAASSQTKQQGNAQATKLCPDCGNEAFASAVCPKCAKGKAGIRKQWVCGENSDHVFYTE